MATVVIYKIKDKASGHVLSLRRTLEAANGRKGQLDEERNREHVVVPEDLAAS